ncbi:MAG: Rpn family recombination-promoting nuclease/putative transposase [Thermoguttaceae bacterium]|nr:Rpn family recombination-promoting nuclease/putative transposase [Thermoguttaceae bacterium]
MKAAKMAGKIPFELPPTADVVFQYLFSSPGAENGLKCFLNAINQSAGRRLVESVKIENPFNIANFANQKTSIVDVKARDEEGKKYDIEMQLIDAVGFTDRVLYYWSKMYSSMLNRGHDYEHLRPVISIVVTRFELFPQLTDLHNVFTLSAEKDPSVLFSDQIEIHSLELIDEKLARLGRLAKEEDENQLQLQNWMDYLLNGNRKTEAEMDTLICGTPGLGETHERYTQFTENDELRELAFAREKYERDHRAQLSYAERHGHALGLARGLVQGEAIGLQKGRAEGERLAAARMLVSILQMRFSESFTQEDQHRIMTISDAEILNALVLRAAAAEDYAEIQKLLKS